MKNDKLKVNGRVKKRGCTICIYTIYTPAIEDDAAMTALCGLFQFKSSSRKIKKKEGTHKK